MTTTAPYHLPGRAVTFVYLMRTGAGQWRADASVTYPAGVPATLGTAWRVFNDAGHRGGRTEYLQVAERWPTYAGPSENCRSILVVDGMVNCDA